MSHWSGIAARWHLVGPPLRPAPADVACFEARIAAAAERVGRPLSALILGVTPELYHLEWPAGARIGAVDGSREMIEAVWPGPGDAAVVGFWTDVPLEDASRDVIVCDGGFGTLDYPDQQQNVLREMHRLLRPGGVFIVRLFSPAGLTGTVDEIGADLRAGRIPSLDALKLRLWGALQTDLETGVRPRDVVAAMERLTGGLDFLTGELGWPEAHVATLELHRDSDAVYHLINPEELAEMAGEVGFTLDAVDHPDHEFGACCPVVALGLVGSE